MAQLTSVINVNAPKEVKEKVIPFEVTGGNSKFSKHLLDALEEGDAILNGKKTQKVI